MTARARVVYLLTLLSVLPLVTSQGIRHRRDLAVIANEDTEQKLHSPWVGAADSFQSMVARRLGLRGWKNWMDRHERSDESAEDENHDESYSKKENENHDESEKDEKDEEKNEREGKSCY